MRHAHIQTDMCKLKKQQVNSSIIRTDHGEIEYRTIGNGQPIVFIHGGHSNCHETLSCKGFDLERFQLIIPSRPGYGNTPLANNNTPGKAAGLIAELLEILSIDKAIIYGISAGGLTAIELAAVFPDKVDKLILASAVSKKWLDPQERIYKAARIIFHPKMEGMTWGIVRFFSKLFPLMIAKSFYPQFSAETNHKLRKEDIKELIAALNNYRSKNGFINDIDQNIDQEMLNRVDASSLVIHSKNDNSVPYEHAVHSHKMLKNSTLVELKNEWGHLFWIGCDSNESISKIMRFINEEKKRC
jgi:pimeloyl-ACP methyl ester carboxylesterase